MFALIMIKFNYKVIKTFVMNQSDEYDTLVKPVYRLSKLLLVSSIPSKNVSSSFANKQACISLS